jgi:hypothetical protein
MRVSDMPPEEQRAYYEQLQRTFERVDELNADLAERAERRRLDGTELEERYAARQRQERARAATPQPAPAPRAPRAPPRDWQAEQKWVEGIAGRKITNLIDNGLTPFAKQLGEDLARIDKRIADLEKQAAADAAAVVELLRELEARVAGLEQRTAPTGLRLIAGRSADGDAA